MREHLTVSFLDDLERAIRDNNPPPLAHLTKIKSRRIPRQLLARFANLVRRLGGINYALKILNPAIRNRTSKPSVSELVEYALCLNRLKLTAESLEIFKNIENENNPEITYGIAAAYVSNWDYRSAIPYFENYCNKPGLSPYKKLIGEINLAASYNFIGALAQSLPILNKIVTNAEAQGFNLLVGNAYELLGEIAIARKDYDGAFVYLEKATKLIKGSIPRYQLYVDRWRAIAQLLKDNASKSSLRLCERVRQRALELGEWNIVREIELYVSVATHDEEKLRFIYFGGPHVEFRKRIIELYPHEIFSNENYDLVLGDGKVSEKNVFLVKAGKDLATGAQLKTGQALHRLLQVLASDFYYPFSTAKLFSLVFKGLKYNPITSRSQIYEVVSRLNYFFSESKIPLVVDSQSGSYRLIATRPYILRVPAHNQDMSKVSAFIESLRRAGMRGTFSAGAVEKNLKLPKRTTTRLLSEAVNANLLSRKGSGRYTIYILE